MNESASTIPCLNLSDFINGGENKQKFIRELGEAFEKIGFAAIKNTYLNENDSPALYKYAGDFFSLPDSIKEKYELKELFGQRGYIGKGKEHAKGTAVGDLKEFFHVGQPLGYDLPENVDVEEVPELLDISLRVYNSLEKTGIELLRAISLYLGLYENYFDEKVKGADSILRLIHYYPINGNDNPKAVRAAAHGDINLITLLMGASAEGLEILNRKGEWVKVTAIKDHLVVNVGDMLERMTNKKLRSTIHRVVNPPGMAANNPRFSMPFFMHPRKEISLNCLPECIDESSPKGFKDTTAGEFLKRRLVEIGLKT